MTPDDNDQKRNGTLDPQGKVMQFPLAPPSVAPSRAEREPEPAIEPLAVPIRDFLGDDEDDIDTPEPCVIDGILPVGVPAALAGLPKSLKTYVVADMGVCVAAGIPWCGRATLQGRVVLYLQEDTRRQVRRRMWWLARGHHLDPRLLPISLASLPAMMFLDDDAHVDRIIAESKGAALVVIDSLSRVHDADENDRTAMRRVTLALSRIAAETGATVLVIHHYRKAGALDGSGKIQPGQRMAGTRDLHAVVRAVIGVEKVTATKEYSEIHITPESNYGEPVEPFALRFSVEQRADGKRVARFVAASMLSAAAASALRAIQGGATSVEEIQTACGGKNEKWRGAVAELVKRGALAPQVRGQPLRLLSESDSETEQ